MGSFQSTRAATKIRKITEINMQEPYLVLSKRLESNLSFAVFEIKGALAARRAHFRRRAHVFQTCAPDVRTFCHSIPIAIY